MRAQRKQCQARSKYTKRCSDEHKQDAIELVRSSSRTVTEVARELGVSSESLRGWVKKNRAAQDTGSGSVAGRAGQSADDRDEELKRLRKLTAEQAKTIEILKSDGLLCEGERPVSAICRLVHAEKANYPVTLLCKVMKTARSTYYAWVAGRAAREARRRADEALGSKRRSTPASGPTARPPASASSTSSRPSTTDAARVSTPTGATSHPTRHACATSRTMPPRRNDDVSKITRKLHVNVTLVRVQRSPVAPCLPPPAATAAGSVYRCLGI